MKCINRIMQVTEMDNDDNTVSNLIWCKKKNDICMVYYSGAECKEKTDGKRMG